MRQRRRTYLSKRVYDAPYLSIGMLALTAHGVLAQAFVVVGDHNGHVGLGVKCAKEVRCPPPFCWAVSVQIYGED